MKKFNFILWGIIAVIILSSVFGVIKMASKQSSETNNGKVSNLIISEKDHVKGDKNLTNVPVLIEYSDFQCPACGSYHPLLTKLNQEMAGKMIFIYRHFPLPQHKNARAAASAAEAAGKQGKFWEMHDLIFENQKDWEGKGNAKEIFSGYAQRLNLDINKYQNDLVLEEIKNKIDADYKSGIEADVNATPSFFLNGRKISPRNYFEFKEAIEKASSQTAQEQIDGQ